MRDSAVKSMLQNHAIDTRKLRDLEEELAGLRGRVEGREAEVLANLEKDGPYAAVFNNSDDMMVLHAEGGEIKTLDMKAPNRDFDFPAGREARRALGLDS